MKSTLAVVHSRDGKSWSGPVVLSDKPSQKDNPRIALSQGAAVVAWQDSAPEPGLYVAGRLGPGSRWSRPVRAGDKSHVGTTDYGQAMLGGRFLLVWGDQRKGPGDQIYAVQGTVASPRS